MNSNLPEIGVVIIGVNGEKHLAGCIDSVIKCDYPQELIQIVYVDGGSKDNSISVAEGFNGVRVIALNDIHPTPGRGRNAGWKALSTPLIQFLDGDTQLNPGWFKRAVPELTEKTTAICGHRNERYPDKNNFHMITNIEWGYETGLCRYFGGDVLITRETLEKTKGYDEELIAGEDPELSYRVRQMGFDILRIDTPMTSHDINMTSLSQYLKRAHRSGHAYAQIALRFIRKDEKLWLRELVRISARTLGPFFLFFAGLFLEYPFIGLVLGLVLLCRPVFSLPRIRRKIDKPWSKTIIYMIHVLFVIYPQFAGAVRYIYGVMVNKPLRNRVS